MGIKDIAEGVGALKGAVDIVKAASSLTRNSETPTPANRRASVKSRYSEDP